MESGWGGILSWWSQYNQRGYYDGNYASRSFTLLCLCSTIQSCNCLERGFLILLPENIKKYACFSLRETPTPGISCSEHVLIIVNSLENVWKPKKSLRYCYAYFTVNSNKSWCYSLAVYFQIYFLPFYSALYCEGKTTKHCLSQALWTTDIQEVQLMRGTGGWASGRRKDKSRHLFPLFVSGDLCGSASVLAMIPASAWHTFPSQRQLLPGSLHCGVAFCWAALALSLSWGPPALKLLRLLALVLTRFSHRRLLGFSVHPMPL